MKRDREDVGPQLQLFVDMGWILVQRRQRVRLRPPTLPRRQSHLQRNSNYFPKPLSDTITQTEGGKKCDSRLFNDSASHDCEQH